ncbi:MAG: hypothetical protein KAT70_04175 [Thermoplasmata archaeon]|nr:hypothetical protein [Thermoplasmata archaeon]
MGAISVTSRGSLIMYVLGFHSFTISHTNGKVSKYWGIHVRFIPWGKKLVVLAVFQLISIEFTPSILPADFTGNSV